MPNSRERMKLNEEEQFVQYSIEGLRRGEIVHIFTVKQLHLIKAKYNGPITKCESLDGWFAIFDPTTNY